MKYIFITLFLSTILYSDLFKVTNNINTHKILREKVKKIDIINSKKRISIKDIQKIANSDGTVDITKLQTLWENQSPTPKKCDWIQTKSGEWFKGSIKTMFKNKLEFKSSEIGLHTFKMEDITQIKSYNILNIKIENLNIFTGIVRIKDKNITIYQEDKQVTFPVDKIVSFAYEGENSLDYWSGSASLNYNKQKGNTNQTDYTTRINLQRVTADTKLSFGYTGNISYVDNDETKNNHRFDAILDYYLSKRLFITPIYSEFYNNDYQNIKLQYTQSFGVGYEFINTNNTNFYISSGPGFIYTKYNTIYNNKNNNTKSLTLITRSKLKYDITDNLTFKWDYKFAFNNNSSGKYKHYMLSQLIIDLTNDLTLNISYTWDHLEKPQKDSNGETPYKNDYTTSMGLGLNF